MLFYFHIPLLQTQYVIGLLLFIVISNEYLNLLL